MFPVIIVLNGDDVSDTSFNFDGIGSFLAGVLIWWIICGITSYFLIGHRLGFDCYGLPVVSGFLGLFAGNAVNFFAFLIYEEWHSRRCDGV